MCAERQLPLERKTRLAQLHSCKSGCQALEAARTAPVRSAALAARFGTSTHALQRQRFYAHHRTPHGRQRRQRPGARVRRCRRRRHHQQRGRARPLPQQTGCANSCSRRNAAKAKSIGARVRTVRIAATTRPSSTPATASCWRCCPAKLKQVCEPLTFREGQLVISLMVTYRLADIERWCGPRSAPRVSPLPAIAENAGTTIVTARNPQQ